MPYPINIGDNSTRELASEWIFDPEIGTTQMRVFEGSESGVLGIAAQFSAARYRGRVYQKEGPAWRGEFSAAPTASEGNDDEVIDEWEFDRDYGQEDIRHSPKVIDLFANSIHELTNAFNFIENQLKKESQTYSPIPGVRTLMYDNMARGQTSYQSYNTVLRRVRTVPINYAGAAVQEAIPTVYGTSALIGAFGIPTNIASRMPPLPSYVPPSTYWGWLQRQDQTKFLPRRGRAVESREWVFAAWSELTYDFVF